MGQNSLDIDALRTAVRDGRIQWQCHSLERVVERGITTEQVKAAILAGELIEDYADAHPFPAALFLHHRGERPLHVGVAFKETGATAYVITAYEPTPEHFEPDFRTRRKT